MKRAPRQSVIIEEVDHDVHCRLNIVSTTLVFASAAIKTGEQEVAGEFLHVLFFDVLSSFSKVTACQTKVNKVDCGWITMPNQYVL